MSHPPPTEKHVLERDERRESIIAWTVICILVGAMFLRALVAIVLYDNPPRFWNYRSRPFIPAQTYQSTRPVPTSTHVEKQVPLPPKGERAR
jgi:hypothetical protein